MIIKPDNISLLLNIAEISFKHKKSKRLADRDLLWNLLERYKNEIRRKLEFDEDNYWPMSICRNCGKHQYQKVRPGKVQCHECG